jgi:hypothetical protein
VELRGSGGNTGWRGWWYQILELPSGSCVSGLDCTGGGKERRSRDKVVSEAAGKSPCLCGEVVNEVRNLG